MRVLFISQWFQPEPTYKGLNFAKALRDRGHEVEVITGFPNYPGGTVYTGYSIRPFQREELDGIRVNRCYLYPSHSASKIGRIWNYLSFALSSTLASLFVRKPDVVYIYTPPMTAALAGLALRTIRRVPFVVDVQDLWPDTLEATGMLRDGPILRLVGLFTDFVMRRAARIVVLSNGFRERLMERDIGRPISVVRNWAQPEIVAIANAAKASPPPTGVEKRPFTVLFAGNIGRAQALEVVVEAAKLLSERKANVRFEIVGGGLEAERLKDIGLRSAPDMLRFHPFRDPSEMGPTFAEADALLVHLRDDPLFEITIPSKTQAYLAVGKPILMGVRGNAASLVEEAGAGLIFEPENPQNLAEAVETLAAMPRSDRARMGANGAEYYARHLEFDIGIDAIADELVKAAGKNGPLHRAPVRP